MEDEDRKRVEENQRLINEAFCAMRAARSRYYYLPKTIELKKGEVYYFEGREVTIKEDGKLHGVSA
ncbi:MAG: hypothetical protein M3416_07540 [Acidobacteriota bacterium]|nr:hypothetical protein [Acidobacteriota bacterium]